jgi:hypothetical protein
VTPKTNKQKSPQTVYFLLWSLLHFPHCQFILSISFLFFAVLGFELWAYTNPIFVMGFFSNYFLGLVSNHDIPDLCLLSS